MMRLTAYASGSVALASAVLLKAVHERTNFFSACIYLSQNSACVIVLVNLLILLVGTLVFGLQRLLYGPLRPVEAEQLYDKAWFAITETCLAMTIFREEIGVWFIILFISLLVGKVWAWIGEGRVEIMDQQPPANPRLFHARISMSLFVSLAFDMLLLKHSVDTVIEQAKLSMMVMFAFEFAVLTTGSVATTLRYLISLREAVIISRRLKERLNELRDQRRRLRQEAGDGTESVDDALDSDVDESQIELPEWEDKSRWILYLELLTDFVRLVLYLIFFVVLCVFYGMPLHIIRDVALALRSFHKRLTDFVKYKRATRDMNERYPDASPDDVRRNDVCIICREPMRPWTNGSATVDQGPRPKKLPCGHILHFGCLRRWLQWQQNCPTCRQPVLSEGVSSVQRVPQAENNTPLAHDDQSVQARRQREERGLPDGQDLMRAADGVHGAAVQHAPQQLRQDEPVNGGWRRFQLGPVTLDIGAWPGDQQAADAEILDPARQGLAPSPASAQYGQHEDEVQAALQLQIDSLEQQFHEHINNLRFVVSQLEATRSSYESFFRSRDSQLPSQLENVQVFRSQEGVNALQTESGNLPAGLTIPEGWTLTPLRRLPRSQESGSGSGGAGPAVDNHLVEAVSSDQAGNAASRERVSRGHQDESTGLPLNH